MQNQNNPRTDKPILPGTDRAQPGDVVGIENDGKTTHLGESRKDENERLRDAEKDAAKERQSR
jgi:hypothetical protein